MRKGWFIIPGLQDGDRTFKEQAEGVWPAFAEGKGKRVLDLGCAEGLLSHEFARRGAVFTRGYDTIADHITIARDLGEGLPCEFLVGNLDDLALLEPEEQFDIVSALGVIHKVWRPVEALRYAARSSSDLLLMRTGQKYVDGMIYSKRDESIQCHVPTVLEEEGFALEKTVKGSRKWHEDVQYWRRK